jgi:LacI family transcriptional regulator
MTTLKDLAQQLSLSTSTVSRALAGHSRISQDTVRRVRGLATELHYRPNEAAASLRLGHRRSPLLGLLVPDLTNSFFACVAKGVAEAARRAGCRLLVCQSNDELKHVDQSVATLLDAQVAGVLVAQACCTPDLSPFEPVRRQGLPLVFIDRLAHDAAVSAVVVDDRLGGYRATRHLLGQGYRRIAHLSGPPHLRPYQNCQQGYEDALREAGLPILPELLVPTNLQPADGARAARQLLALPQPPDAVFAATDQAALGCLEALREQSRFVPAKVGLVGYGDACFCQYLEPALSSVDQHGEQLGRLAVQLLRELPDAGPARQVLLQPTLRARGSSLRPAAMGTV